MEEELIKLLKNDEIIPVLGAGVSYAASKIPGWEGFISEGLDYIEKNHLDDGSSLEIARKALIDKDFPKSGKIMKTLLKAPKRPFSDWIDSLLHDPEIYSSDLLDSIRNLNASIVFTTNYDKLFYYDYTFNTHRIFSWADHRLIKKSMIRKEDFLLHLHGVYDRPETIILSDHDYLQLKDNAAYRNILAELWSNKNFLFIGSSKDGVLDEDFMTTIKFYDECFPDLPHKHFILLKNDEIPKVSKELLPYGIYPIGYGNEYKDLPLYLNRINPNWDKKEEKLRYIKLQIAKEFDKDLLSHGKLTQDQSKVTAFLRKHLPYGVYWVDSIQFVTIEKVFNDYNESLLSKKEQFKSIQLYVNALVEISKLGYFVDLWNKNWGNPEVFANTDFISYAIMANENIKRFPAEILLDIKFKKPNAIHSYYFDGYLEQFINRYKRVSEKGIDSVNGYFKNDRYFYENLKRLIDSLKGILEIDPEDLYEEVNPAIITSEIFYPSYLFVSEKEITLRKPEFPFEVYSAIKAEKDLLFIDGDMLKYGNNSIVVGYNRLGAFYWNPKESLNLKYFFKTSLKSNISEIKNYQINNCIESHILIGKTLIIYQNFSEEGKIMLKSEPEHFLYLSEEKSWIYSKHLSSFEKGPAVFFYNYLVAEETVLLTIEDLWSLLQEIEIIRKNIEAETSEEQRYFHTLRTIDLITFFKKENIRYLIIKIVVQLENSFFTVLLTFKIKNSQLECVGKICLIEKSTITFDVNVNDDKINILVGYLNIQLSLDAGLSSYFFNVENNVIYDKDGKELLDVAKTNGDDVLYVKSFNERENFVSQRHRLYFIDFENSKISSLEMDNVLKISNIK